jgi:hypothetical protein
MKVRIRTKYLGKSLAAVGVEMRSPERTGIVRELITFTCRGDPAYIMYRSLRYPKIKALYLNSGNHALFVISTGRTVESHLVRTNSMASIVSKSRDVSDWRSMVTFFTG